MVLRSLQDSILITSSGVLLKGISSSHIYPTRLKNKRKLHYSLCQNTAYTFRFMYRGWPPRAQEVTQLHFTSWSAQPLAFARCILAFLLCNFICDGYHLLLELSELLCLVLLGLIQVLKLLLQICKSKVTCSDTHIYCVSKIQGLTVLLFPAVLEAASPLQMGNVIYATGGKSLASGQQEKQDSLKTAFS